MSRVLSYAVLPGVSGSDNHELGRKDPHLPLFHPCSVPGASRALCRAAVTRAQAQGSSF